MTAPAAPAPAASEYEGIYRRNFVYFLIDGIFFMVAMGVISSTTVIPDFVRRLTDSEILIGLSSSMFTVGATLPQLFIARYMVRVEHKKWWFIGPNIPVRFVILIFGVIIALLGAERPEAILLAFFICYTIAALGDGLVGVPWGDLIGTSLDNRWRARMFGGMTASTGLIMLGVAPLIGLVLGENGPGFPNNFALLFGVAGVLFAVSTFPVLFVRELPGGKAVAKTPSMGEFLPQLGHVLRTDGPFRAIVVIRLFALLFAMASPYYVGFATGQLGLSSDVAVPNLLLMQTIGGVGGAVIYTWLGAHNNLLFIRLMLAGAGLLPVSALLAGTLGPLPLYLGFLMLGLFVSNNYLSFQNWVVTYATPDQRPVYVGLFNTLTAVVGLMAPFIGGTIAQELGYEPLFAVALVMVLIALFVTVRFLHNPRAEVALEAVPGD